MHAGLMELAEYYKREPFRCRFTAAFIKEIDKLLQDEEEKEEQPE